MNHRDDGTFSSFKQRIGQMGLETISITEYKGFEIQIRSYNGISATIYGIKNEKRLRLRFSGLSFMKAATLLQKQKNYIDEYSDRLNEKLMKI